MSNIINMEIKAKVHNIDEIRKYLLENCTENKGVDHQCDTYFKVPTGRLKLREGNIENSLIFYSREDIAGVKLSNINLVKLPQGTDIKRLLSNANGVLTVVKKKREIYFINNVKFHIDELDLLGSFVEIEAIDDKGVFTKDDLKKQCDDYIKIFKIPSEAMLVHSYSDMVMSLSKGIQAEFASLFSAFSDKVFSQLNALKVDVKNYEVDHACFRVDSMQSYIDYKKKLESIGELLIESEVGGRMISTYKLYSPFEALGRKVSLIELPAPKNTKKYPCAFEHLEFVLDTDFKDFTEKYKSISFDWSAVDKKINPELKLKLGENCSVKFHRESLEKIIEMEKKLLASH